MALVAYNGQDDFGGHSFTADDGSELYVPDSPEARQFAAQIAQAPVPEPEAKTTLSAMQDRANGAAAANVAQNVYGADPSQQRPVAAPMATDAGGAPAPQPTPVSAPSPAAPTAGERVASQVYGAPEIPTLPIAASAQPADATGLSPAEQALITKPNPGGAGVSQKQLEKKATQGVVIPKEHSYESQGGVPVNPELEHAYEQAKVHEYNAQSAIAQADMAQADAARQQAQAERIHLENQQVAYQAHQKKMEWEAQAKISALNDFDTEAQQRYAEFGPNRFFKQNGGTWAVIGAAIAQGLGAYASIVGGGPNHAANIIQGAIDRDIQSQRDEYLRDKDARNNLVAEIARATGDLDTATEGAKAIQLGIAKAYGDELAALSKRADVQKQWALWGPQFEQGVIAHKQSAYEKSLGNVIIKDSGQFAYPQAGGGGGPLSIEQLAKREEAATRIVEARQKRSEGGDNSLEIAPGVYARKGQAVEAKDVRAKLTDLDAADKALEQLQKDVSEHPIAAAVGGATLPWPYNTVPISPKGSSIASRTNIATGALSQLSGSGVVNPGEYPRLVKAIQNPAGIQGVRDELAIKKRALLSGHSSKPLPPQPKEKE